jgi:serine protease Do
MLFEAAGQRRGHMVGLLVRLVSFAVALSVANVTRGQSLSTGENSSVPAPAVSRNEVLKGAADLSSALEYVSLKAGSAVVQVLAQGISSPDVSSRSVGTSVGQDRIGSGFLLSSDGYILTNAHVIAGANHLKVRLARRAAAEAQRQGDKSVALSLEAKVIGIDHETDLALLKIGKTELPYLSFGDSGKLRQGQLIIAVGSPFGLDSSVSLGVVSALSRRVKPEERMVYVQTDAAINPGNSGGPLMNLDGEVVGINTMIMSQSGGSQGVGFAIPSEIASVVYEQLKANKRVKRARLGFVAETINPQMAEILGLQRGVGAVVSDVDDGGPADQAGIQTDDIILAIGGRPIERMHQLELCIYELSPGSLVHIHLQRGSQALNVDLRVAELPPTIDNGADLLDNPEAYVQDLGIVGLSLSSAHFKLPGDLRRPDGIVVVNSNTDDTYASNGLTRGDVIYEVNRQVVVSVDELRAAVSHAKEAGMAVLLVERDGHLVYVPVDLN